MWPFRPKTPPAAPEAPLKTYADADFDIEGMPVFSIERDTRKDVTIIGYRSPTAPGGNVEWHLPVSPTAHDALLRRFRTKMGGGPVAGQPSTSTP